MATVRARKGTKVVFIQPGDCKTFELATYTVEATKVHQYDKKNIYISCISSNLITKTTVELSKETKEAEQIEDEIVQATYNELRIDPETPCTIKYTPRGVSYYDQRNEYDVYLIENSTLLNKFSQCVSRFPYIDLIIPTPFLFNALYASTGSASILEKEGVDGFVYFTYQDSFFLLYEDGKLLYYKPLSITMAKLYETFNLYSTESIDHDTFSKIVSGEYGAQAHKSALSKMFEDTAASVEEVIIYIKRIYNISTINNIYIDSDTGFNGDFYDFLGAYLGTNCSKFNFDYGITVPKGVSHISTLALILAKQYADQGIESDFNFTIYHKPKPFPQRDSGHLIIAAAASFVLAFSYPAAMYVQGILLGVSNGILQEGINTLTAEHTALMTKVNELTIEKQKKSDIFEIARRRTEEQKNILYAVYETQKEYSIKTETIIGLVDDVLKSGIKIDKIDIKDGNFTDRTKTVVMDINSIEHRKITEFIKTIADNRKYGVSVNDINFDANSSRYLSRVNIVLR